MNALQWFLKKMRNADQWHDCYSTIKKKLKCWPITVCLCWCLWRFDNHPFQMFRNWSDVPTRLDVESSDLRLGFDRKWRFDRGDSNRSGKPLLQSTQSHLWARRNIWSVSGNIMHALPADMLLLGCLKYEKYFVLRLELVNSTCLMWMWASESSSSF